MERVIGIKFQDHGLIYYFDPAGHEVGAGDVVVVDTEQGAGIGRVIIVNETPPTGIYAEEIKPVLRRATDEDLNTMRENETMAAEAKRICREYVRENNIDMKIIGVEVFFDRSKMIFYFTSPGRVDFRDMVKHLLKIYRSRIEMRQIGVRHETQMLGGIGNCGMVCCCRSTLRKFVSATIKMAKEQNLFLTPPKISGACGRLLCCLSFEHDTYEDFHRRCPKLGKRFQTDNGKLKVLRANLFQQSLVVQNEEGAEQEITLAAWAELHPKRLEGGQQDDKAAPLSEFGGRELSPDRKRHKPSRMKPKFVETTTLSDEVTNGLRLEADWPNQPDPATEDTVSPGQSESGRPTKEPDRKAKRHHGPGKGHRDQHSTAGRPGQESKGGADRGHPDRRHRDGKVEAGPRRHGPKDAPAGRTPSGPSGHKTTTGHDQPQAVGEEARRHRHGKKRRDKNQDAPPA